MENIKDALPILKTLLAAEISEGRTPGSARPGINDAPEQVRLLINKIDKDIDGSENDREFRILIGSVSGAYLGRGELFWQLGLDRVTPAGFDRKLQMTIKRLIELAHIKTISYDQ